jgi:hypothetical protein
MPGQHDISTVVNGGKRKFCLVHKHKRAFIRLTPAHRSSDVSTASPAIVHTG